MSDLFLAIDNGSQSTKVAVIDRDGTVVASARVPLRATVLGPGGRVQHPGDDVWDSIATACRAVAQELGDRVRDIAAIGLCTIRFCRAYLDGAGRLTEPMLSWMDARVSRGVTDLDPAVEWITTSSGYITHRLTGRFVDTAGNYQGVWPIDQSTWRWSADDAAFERTGMPRDILFALVDPGALAGDLTANAAAATGLPAGLPVFTSSNDKAVEALGSGLLGPSAALLSLGTYIAAMIVADRPQELGDAGWRNFGAIPGQYLYESHGIRRGMWTASWFRELLGDGVTDEELGAEAELVPAGSGGLVAILDWLAPTDAPYRRGALLGFDGTQGRGAIYRALLEGIAFTMHGHLARLIGALNVAPEYLIVSGGGSKSELMLQIVANLAGIPAKRLAVPDAAGLGAAITAAVGVGAFPGWREAVARMVHVDTVKVPTAAESAQYAALAERYAQVTAYTDPLFRMLSGDSPVPTPNN